MCVARPSPSIRGCACVLIIAPMAIIIVMAQATSHTPCASNCACAEGLHFSAFHCMCNNTCALVEILGVGNQAKHSSKALREDGMRERRALHDVCMHCIARHTCTYDIRTYIHTYDIHTYIHTYVHMCIHTCTYIHFGTV